MVFAHVPFDYLYLSAQARLSYQLSRSFGYLSFQHLIPVFRYPHKVILDVIQRMRSASILRHCIILATPLKLFRLKAKDSTGRLDIEKTNPRHDNKVMSYLVFTIVAYFALAAVSAAIMLWNMTVGSIFFMVSGFAVMWPFILKHEKAKRTAADTNNLAAVDAVSSGQGLLEPKPQKTKRGSVETERYSLPLPADLETDLRTIAAVDKTEAVKQVQDLTGMRLSEARTYVETLGRR